MPSKIVYQGTPYAKIDNALIVLAFPEGADVGAEALVAADVKKFGGESLTALLAQTEPAGVHLSVLTVPSAGVQSVATVVYCDGQDLVYGYRNGNGGHVLRVVAPDSPSCAHNGV